MCHSCLILDIGVQQLVKERQAKGNLELHESRMKGFEKITRKVMRITYVGGAEILRIGLISLLLH